MKLTQEYAVEIENIGKKYHLGQISTTSFTHEMQSKWAKLRKQEDPNAVVTMDAEPAEELQEDNDETFWALKHIDLKIKKGEVLGVIGENGSGKSTLLKILSRITAPTTGEIKYVGRIASMLEVGTGFNPEMTGRENIYLNGAILGMGTEEIEAKINKIIAFSEVADFIDTPVKRYSSGMYVKLAFSVAAHLDSDILIMDEVLAVGDVRFQAKCIDKMQAIARDEGRTVIFVTHSIGSLQQLCTRCIVLKKGAMVFEGEVDEAVAFYTGRVITVSTEINKVFDTMGKTKKTQKAILLGLDIEDRATAIYDAEEAVRFVVHWDSMENCAEIVFRCVVKQNGLTSVGMSFSKPIIVQKNQRYDTVISLDASHLVQGRYTVDIYVGIIEDSLVQVFDGVGGAFGFTIQSNKSHQSLHWAAMAWGSYVMPTLQIENQST